MSDFSWVGFIGVRTGSAHVQKRMPCAGVVVRIPRERVSLLLGSGRDGACGRAGGGSVSSHSRISTEKQASVVERGWALGEDRPFSFSSSPDPCPRGQPLGRRSQPDGVIGHGRGDRRLVFAQKLPLRSDQLLT